MKLEISEYTEFLFDIEGTVAPISFVHEILFPYAAKELKNYIFNNTISGNAKESILEDNKLDLSNGSYTSILNANSSKEEFIDYLQYLIKVDRKNSGLKEIQGTIWEKGYSSGEIKSIIFPDTILFFRRIKELNKSISIYSSGSILAQKLIFKYSEEGDLTEFIDNYFDTSSGPKRESKSYNNISQKLNSKPNNIIFFTDIIEEARAAKEAGIKSILLNRKGNAPQSNKDEFPELEDFTSLFN